MGIGGNVVDKSDKVIISSPETEKALNYAKALYENYIPGTASWNDSFNNKAFLGGEVHWTNNGISIYVAAQNDASKSRSPRTWIMRSGRWDRSASRPNSICCIPLMAMTYTKYPQACKALMAYMLEADQFNPWLTGVEGLSDALSQRLRQNPVWTADKKTTPFRDVAKRTLTAGGLGSVGEKAASAIADFVVLDMFAAVCTGREDPKGAIKIADRQLRRIYR